MAMNSVDDFAHRVVLSNGIILPVMMSRIDILAPILDLKGIEEKLVFDLHYSLEKMRTWNASAVREAATSIRGRLAENRIFVLDEVGERIEEFRAEEIVDQWNSGLDLLTNMMTTDQMLSWERHVEDGGV